MNKFEQHHRGLTKAAGSVARIGMAILKAQALDDLERISKDPDVLAAIRKSSK